MEQSLTLLTAQVHFLDTELVLIHIPLHLYSAFIQPLIQLILPAESTQIPLQDDFAAGSPTAGHRRQWAYEHQFVNISVTPVECSVVCCKALANKLFEPIRDSLAEAAKEQVTISTEEYVVIQVDGEGLDAGQRVLELSSPLAMNGISIFFITTYFSDYILVPTRSRAAVITALEARGFAFSHESEGFVNVSSPILRPSELSNHNRSSSSQSSLDYSYSRPQSRHQLQQEPQPSFAAAASQLPTPSPSAAHSDMNHSQITPTVDRTLKLVQVAARKDTIHTNALDSNTNAPNHSHPSVGDTTSTLAAQHCLQLGLIKCLTTLPRASFFSLTLTDTEPASLLLERRLLVNFGDEPAHGAGDEVGDEDDGSGSDEVGANEQDSILLGNKQEVLVPIMLDLRELPMQTTGIVCSVAGRLVGAATLGDTDSGNGDAGGGKDGNGGADANQDHEQGTRGAIEMSYLSTARAGTVMVAERELDRALRALARGHAESESKPQESEEQDQSPQGLEIRTKREGAQGMGRDW